MKLEKLPPPPPLDLAPASTTEEQEAAREKALANAAARAVLKLEAVILSKLQRFPFVGRFIEYGRDLNQGVAYLLMSLLGENLLRLRRRRKDGKFTLPTVLRFGIQAIRCIQAVHEIGFLHRDIKPSNFVIGSNRGTTHGAMMNQGQGLPADDSLDPSSASFFSPSRIFIIDFGLARAYRDRTTGVVLPSRGHIKGFRGTPRYASVNVHREEDLGRRDDLWSLLYILIEFATGDLPWGSKREKEEIGMIKEEYMSLKLLRIGQPGEIPSCFVPFMKHLYSLKFESKPNYAYLIELLQHKLHKMGYGKCEGDGGEHADPHGMDCPFDWEDVETRSTLAGESGDCSVKETPIASGQQQVLQQQGSTTAQVQLLGQIAPMRSPSEVLVPITTTLSSQQVQAPSRFDGMQESSLPQPISLLPTATIPSLGASPSPLRLDTSIPSTIQGHVRSTSVPIFSSKERESKSGEEEEAQRNAGAETALPMSKSIEEILATPITAPAHTSLPPADAQPAQEEPPPHPSSSPPATVTVSSVLSPTFGLPLSQPIPVPDSVVLSPRKAGRKEAGESKRRSSGSVSLGAIPTFANAATITTSSSFSSSKPPLPVSLTSKPPRHNGSNLKIALDSNPTPSSGAGQKVSPKVSPTLSPSPSPSPDGELEDLRADLLKQRTLALSSASPNTGLDANGQQMEWMLLPTPRGVPPTQQDTSAQAAGAFTSRLAAGLVPAARDSSEGEEERSDSMMLEQRGDGRTVLPSHLPAGTIMQHSLNDAYLLSNAPDASLAAVGAEQKDAWIHSEFAGGSLAPALGGMNEASTSFILAPMSSPPRWPNNSPVATPQRAVPEIQGLRRIEGSMLGDDTTTSSEDDSDTPSQRARHRSSPPKSRIASIAARIDMAANPSSSKNNSPALSRRSAEHQRPGSMEMALPPPHPMASSALSNAVVLDAAPLLSSLTLSNTEANQNNNALLSAPLPADGLSHSYVPVASSSSSSVPVLNASSNTPPHSPRHFKPSPPGAPPPQFSGLRFGRFKGRADRSPAKPLSSEQIAALNLHANEENQQK